MKKEYPWFNFEINIDDEEEENIVKCLKFK